MTRLAIVAAALASLLGGLPLPQEQDGLARDQVNGPLGEQLDSQLARLAEYGFSGTVLVAQGGEILLLKGYGLANVEGGILNTAATRFEMNSITKMFTGVAILQLAAQGRLQLTDSVARHIDGLPPAKTRATIEQLAMHTAGLIPAGTSLAGESRDAFVHDVARVPIESRPGERYRYSNAGFSLLAAVIEAASEQPYEEYLRRNLFDPAGMRNARFRNEVPANDARFAHGYVGTPEALQPGPPNPYGWGAVGAGGVWTTVGDIYKWVVSLEEGRVLPAAQRHLLFTPPRPPSEEAFGWHVRTVDGRERVDKGGGSDDFASQLLYWPRERTVIVWASNNLRQRWRTTLNLVLPAVVFGQSSLSLPPVVAVSQAMIDARRHTYVADRGTLDLRTGAGYLYVAANEVGVPTNVMFYPQAPDRFTGFDPATSSLTRLEFTDAAGQFVSAVLPDGSRLRARRAPDAVR